MIICYNDLISKRNLLIINYFCYSDSLLKCTIEKDVVGHPTTMTSGTGVYVIEEHFHRPEALHAKMFATEV